MALKGSESCKIQSFIGMFWVLRNLGMGKEWNSMFFINESTSGRFIEGVGDGHALSVMKCRLSTIILWNGCGDIWTDASLTRFSR